MKRIPYYTRVISDDITELTVEILKREEQEGFWFIKKEVERLNLYLNHDGEHELTWYSVIDDRVLEYYIDIAEKGV